MNRSRKIAFAIPNRLLEAIEILLARGAFGPYPTRNSYIVGRLLCDVLDPEMHEVGSHLANLHAREQDSVHELLLKSVKAGEDIREFLSDKPTAAELLALAKARKQKPPRLFSRSKRGKRPK